MTTRDIYPSLQPVEFKERTEHILSASIEKILRAKSSMRKAQDRIAGSYDLLERIGRA